MSGKKEEYRGWSISYKASRPDTGKYRAERFGVGMCAGTHEALLRMIDTQIFIKKEGQNE